MRSGGMGNSGFHPCFKGLYKNIVEQKNKSVKYSISGWDGMQNSHLASASDFIHARGKSSNVSSFPIPGYPALSTSPHYPERSPAILHTSQG